MDRHSPVAMVTFLECGSNKNTSKQHKCAIISVMTSHFQPKI